jgi:hypothetical protein
MSTFLVETKQEYTTQLINILTPLIYEGLQSIYSEVTKISTPDNILKNFQLFMQRIPKWNNEMIDNETQRIMNNSKSYSWLEDLIKATLKANIIVLTYNPSIQNQIKVEPSLYQNIKINDFIHKIYIECARELWNNPYLFYHNYPPIELKRNQRDSICLIKDCIKEAIRKLLPVKHILQIYLGEEMELGLPDNNFDKSISEVEEKNLNKLIKKDLYNDTNNTDLNVFKPNIDSITINGVNAKSVEKIEPKDNKSSEINTVGSKILDIINNKDIKLTDNKTSENTLDTKIKKVLENDLNESDTSITHNPNHNYQEVFSNSIQKEEKPINNGTSQNKQKFFANYLHI